MNAESQKKAQATRRKNQEAKEAAHEEHRSSFRDWLREEREISERIQADPKNVELRKERISIWHRQPQWDG